MQKLNMSVTPSSKKQLLEANPNDIKNLHLTNINADN